MREVNQRMYNRVLQAFAGDVEVGSNAIYGVCVRFMDSGLSDWARSILAHSFDMHEEEPPFYDGVRTYTECYLETFRRAFYDEETAKIHGTGYVAVDPRHLGVITSMLIELALAIQGPDVEPEEPEEITPTGKVLQFPGSKVLN